MSTSFVTLTQIEIVLSQDRIRLCRRVYCSFFTQAVRQQILQLLTPITMNHTIVFLASLADVWYQRRRREGSGVKSVRAVPVASEDQIIVVDIVYAIKVGFHLLWKP